MGMMRWSVVVCLASCGSVASGCAQSASDVRGLDDGFVVANPEAIGLAAAPFWTGYERRANQHELQHERHARADGAVGDGVCAAGGGEVRERIFLKKGKKPLIAKGAKDGREEREEKLLTQRAQRKSF